MVPHLGPLKWKRSYLILKRYCVPNQKEGRGGGGWGFLCHLGGVPNLFQSFWSEKKRARKHCQKHLSYWGLYLVEDSTFAIHCWACFKVAERGAFSFRGIKKLWGQSRNPNHQGHWLVLTEREPWGEGVQFGIWTPNLCRRCFLWAANSDFISKLSWAELV